MHFKPTCVQEKSLLRQNGLANQACPSLLKEKDLDMLALSDRDSNN